MWCVKGRFGRNMCFPGGKQRFFKLRRSKKVAKTHGNYVRNGCLRNVLKIDGFLTKIELQNVANTTQKNNIFGMAFAWEFDVFFEHVLIRKWSQNGSKKGSKIDPKMMRNRCPRQDAVLGRFWLILDRFWVDFGTILGWFWDDLGFILGLFLKGFWRPFVAASVANYMTSLRMRTSQLQQKSSQLLKNMRFPYPQLADQVWHAMGRWPGEFNFICSRFSILGGILWAIFSNYFWTWTRMSLPYRLLAGSM